MSRTITKTGFYAVNKGHTVGVFRSWEDCQIQIKGYPNAKFKKFDNAADAEAFVAGNTLAAPAGTSNKSGSSAPLQSTSNSMPQNPASKKRGRSPDVDETGWVVVYSDGACKGNGQLGSVAGVGVWWGHDDPRNIAERCPGDQTNNRAELIAIIRVLETTPHSKTPLLIKTDSQYSISCFKEWLPKWRRNGFQTSNGTPVKNKGVIRYLSALLDKRKENGQTVRLQYVKGHSGQEGNEGADYQANLGARLPPLNEVDWDAKRASLLAGDTVPPTETVEAPLEVSDDENEDPVPESRESPLKIRRIHSPEKSTQDKEIPSQETQNISEGQYEEFSYDSEMFDYTNKVEQQLLQKPPVSSPLPSSPILAVQKPANVNNTVFVSTSRSSPVSSQRKGGEAFISTKPAGSQNQRTEFSCVISHAQKQSFSSVSSPIRRPSPAGESSAFVSVRPSQDQYASPVPKPTSLRAQAKAPAPKLSEQELEEYADCLLNDYDLENEIDDF